MSPFALRATGMPLPPAQIRQWPAPGSSWIATKSEHVQRQRGLRDAAHSKGALVILHP
jgi:hypothetical protein